MPTQAPERIDLGASAVMPFAWMRQTAPPGYIKIDPELLRHVTPMGYVQINLGGILSFPIDRYRARLLPSSQRRTKTPRFNRG